jgi:RimJ/RimL family protein N-acetyltransferase
MNSNDFEAVQAYASDPEVCKFMEWGPNTPEETKNHLAKCTAEERQTPRTVWTFALIRKTDGLLIGSCSLTINGQTNKQASMGYVLRRDVWGQGYATEGAKAVLDFGFQTLALHRIWATCRPDNIGSAKVMQKIGMEYEGRLKDDKFFRGEWYDSLMYASVNT